MAAPYSAIKKTLSELQQYLQMQDPEQCDFVLCNVYLHWSLGAIQASPNYIPAHEFDYLEHLFVSVLPISYDEVFASLLSGYIQITDILLHRDPARAQSRWKKLKSAVEKILADLTDPEATEKSAPFLIELTGSDLQTQLMHLPNAKKIFTNRATWPATLDLVRQNSPLLHATLLPVLSKLSTDYAAGLEELFTLYLTLKISAKIFAQIITHIVCTVQDNSRVLIEKFFTIYQKKYIKYKNKISVGKRHVNKLNLLLDDLFCFIAAYDNLLPAGELSAIFSQLQFNLPDPNHKKIADAYNIYQMIMMVWLGDGIATDYFENDDYESFADLWRTNTLTAYLVACGRTHGQQYPLQSLRELDALPIFMRAEIIALDPALQIPCREFITRYQRINNQAKAHPINITYLFLRLHNTAMHLLIMMGAQALALMSSYMQYDAVRLERLLKFPIHAELIIPFADYYQNHPELTKNNSHYFYGLIIMTHVLLTHALDKLQMLAKLLTWLGAEYSPSVLASVLYEAVVKQLFPEVLTQYSPQQLIERVRFENFVNLAVPSLTNQKQSYFNIYLKLLALDLTGGDVDHFLHDLSQTDPVGQHISQHNNKIKTELLARGFNLRSALYYDKSLEFTLTTQASELDRNIQYQTVWQILTDLHAGLSSLVMPTPQITAIIRHIMMIKNNMGKASRGNQSIQANIITRVLTKNENLALLKKIYSGLTILVRNKQLSADLLQFSNSFLESYAEILKSGSADVRDPNNKSYQLVAYQWSKANANTFLLGKDVGCCMAPDGMAFDAFIARRLDDAIIFHVVRNQLTNKIIAVAWLYLAITSDNQVVLVANFFDVNFKIGQQPALRQALLTGLLKFIEQYLQDNPQITRFYMTPMGYGWNEGDLNSYEMVKLDIVDKIGGLYIPTTVPEFFKKCMTLYNAYNLNFADEDEFHCFSNEVLNREVAMMPNLRLPLASAPFNSSPKRRRCEFWQPNDRNLELVSPTASQPSGNGHDFPLPKSK